MEKQFKPGDLIRVVAPLEQNLYEKYGFSIYFNLNHTSAYEAPQIWYRTNFDIAHKIEAKSTMFILEVVERQNIFYLKVLAENKIGWVSTKLNNDWGCEKI